MSSSLQMRSVALVRANRRHAVQRPASTLRTRPAVSAAKGKDIKGPLSAPPQLLLKALTAFGAASVALTGPAFADLDTTTQEKGLASSIEYSDISNEDSTELVKKLQAMLPDVRAQLSAAAEGSGSTYPDSVVKELETMENQIGDLLAQAESGKDPSVIKSYVSGIEQHVNALKSNVGFD